MTVLLHTAISYLAFVLLKHGCLKQFTRTSSPVRREAPGRRGSPRRKHRACDSVLPAQDCSTSVEGKGGAVVECSTRGNWNTCSSAMKSLRMEPETPCCQRLRRTDLVLSATGVLNVEVSTLVSFPLPKLTFKPSLRLSTVQDRCVSGMISTGCFSGKCITI